jgi:glycine hydroxymethyltransferase
MERKKTIIAEDVRGQAPLEDAPHLLSTMRGATGRPGLAGFRGSGGTPGHVSLQTVDPLLADLVEREARRQAEKVILIPSESVPHSAVLEALASPFTSLYAEGCAPRRMRRAALEDLERVDAQLEAHRSLGNDRYYQGAELADVVEAIAERRIAACFASERTPADRIHVNVQPLSGSAANLAAYEALLRPGDVLMAMALTEGGHLTHGAPCSLSGRLYRTVWYATDPRTGRLDYDEIRYLAREHRPRLLVGGFTSYPWRPDWEQYRAIADEVGAFLLADMAHAAGLIVGGVYPNPIGIADVVTLTTHKTLCGPRGAAILTTDEKIARRVDRAVFPGLQGGPHVNKIAAIAVAMKLAKLDAFRALQWRIVENARHLALALERRGMRLAYGGTDTHFLLIDLRPLGLRGNVVARALDRAGIVCNRNVVPGDRSVADPHGIRLGTTWASQRGMGPSEMEDLAEIIAAVLRALSERGDSGRSPPRLDRGCNRGGGRARSYARRPLPIGGSRLLVPLLARERVVRRSGPSRVLVYASPRPFATPSPYAASARRKCSTIFFWIAFGVFLSEPTMFSISRSCASGGISR